MVHGYGCYSHHLTSEMGKLSTHEPYRGHDQVRTTNEAGMHISHVGQASLLTHKPKQLHLLNVLQVPSATRSLLSVQNSKKNVPHVLGIDKTMKRVKLSEDIIIKAQDMRDVPIRGRLCHGLYALDVSPVHQVFSGVRVSSTHWHVRLGHPATPIVHHVLRRHDLVVVVSNKIVETVCDAYH